MGVNAAAQSTSSFWIVPCPWPSVNVAPVTLVMLTKNVSSGSNAVSPLTSTLKVDVELPWTIDWPVRVFAVKSLGEAAEFRRSRCRT